MNMPAPAKPKRTRKNQAPTFNETLNPAFAPVVPVAPELPVISTRQLRVALWIVWIAAVILGGIGIGRLIVTTRNAPQTRAEAPVPVAKAAVNVTPLAEAASLRVAPIAPVPATLTATPATAVAQAQAGSPFQTAAISTLQTADASVQPGFAPFGRVQGQIGTDPVR
jgi:hypothetical protein